eukprot:5082529-Karenia_brevis.AAC.1
MRYREQFGIQRQRCFKECGQDYIYGTLEIRRGTSFVVHPFSTETAEFRSAHSEWEWYGGPGKPDLAADCLRNHTVYGPEDI